MTPLQAAVGVVQKGLRPTLPPNCPPVLAEVMLACWDASPAHRPTFKDLTPRLQALLESAREEEARGGGKGGAGGSGAGAPRSGLLSKLNLRGGGGGGGGGGRGDRS
jgi:uncharacterized membrane protein YgcG